MIRELNVRVCDETLTLLLHEAEEVVEEVLAVGRVVDLVEL